MLEPLPDDWSHALAGELASPYFLALQAFVDGERAERTIFPPAGQVFSALRETPLEAVKVVVVGQDPYHGAGQAHGLCFSVAEGVKPPPSLVNIFKELHADLGHPIPKSGSLLAWARQGVLLLNTVMTVREGEANSHKDRGWERFTDAVLRLVHDRDRPAVFVLWGNHAQKKGRLIDRTRHAVIAGAHPSPLSARLFFGSRPFSKVNEALAAQGQPPIDWRL